MVIQMAIGYALISTSPNLEKNVLNALRNIDGVKESHLLAGQYDIIAKIETDNINEIGKIVVNHIRKIEGVIHTKTLCTFTLSHLK